MTRIKPFRAIRPTSELASRVIINHGVAGNHPVARREIKDNPYSFLHINHADFDLTNSDEDYVSDANVFATSRAALARFFEEGTLVRDADECYYIYRLSKGNHVQTGLVCLLDTAEYDDGTVKRHENTRTDKVRTQEKQIEIVGGSVEPILLSYEDKGSGSSLPDVLAEAIAVSVAVYDFVDKSDVRNELWAITNRDVQVAIEHAFASVGDLYICDGHHRMAASSLYGSLHPDSPGRYFMAVVYPSSEMRVLDYSRIVVGLNGLSISEFLDQVSSAGFLVRSFCADCSGHCEDTITPRAHGTYAMYLAGQWYELISGFDNDSNDPVENLDVKILQDYILSGILGVTDPKTDPRLSFVSGSKPSSFLAEQVDALSEERGLDCVGFIGYPVTMSEIMDVADAGEIMPPKSTCFDPKPDSGLLMYSVED